MGSLQNIGVMAILVKYPRPFKQFLFSNTNESSHDIPDESAIWCWSYLKMLSDRQSMDGEQ